LWEPEHWPNKEELPSPSKIMAAHANMQGVTADSIDKRLKEGYVKRLY